MNDTLARMPAGLPPELACPRCRGPLDGALACAAHGCVGARSPDGVFEFDRTEDYWGEVSRDSMRRINAAARQLGWRTALDTILRAEHPDLVRYVQHPARSEWHVLLPLDRERTVAVDVGAGWGANSFGLLPHVARLYAVEKIPERIEFLGLRCREAGAAALVPVRADLQALPFAPESIDGFVVNGVLEWAGVVDPGAHEGRRTDPRALQERFLRQLATLLRPGGWLYVGIENRFGRMFWRGTRDHQGLRFTSLMPKPVARAYTALRAATAPRTHRTERDYRTYIYSFGGYVRLLEACGFVDVRRYAVMPGYNVPTVLAAIEGPGPLRYLARHARAAHPLRGGARRAWRQALAASGLEARLTSCYALVARRPPEPGVERAR